MAGGTSIQPVEGTVVAERFQLLRPLGQGGMGAVWVAQQLSLDTPCALKFLHADAAASAELRGRFEREAKAAAQLRSPNVVQILDHGVWQGLPYIAMELLEGEDLDRRLRRTRTLGPHETASIIAQIARALTRAHAAGLIHRDLKPGNIFLVRDDDREIAKVLDFGIAKRTQIDIGDASTKTGSLLGTPFFMSPEQARGTREVDHRTDLWALGVITYRCLVGHLPFRGPALGDLFMKIMAEPIPVPSQHAPVPPGFDAWWARAVQRDPNLRFQSARELADALPMALGISAAPGLAMESRPPFASLPLVELQMQPYVPVLEDTSAAVGTVYAPPASTVTAVMSPPRPSAPSRSSVIAAAAACGVLLASGAFFALRAASPSTPAPAAAQPGADVTAASPAPTAPAAPPAPASAIIPAATAPSPAPAPVPSAAPAPVASAAPVPSAAPVDAPRARPPVEKPSPAPPSKPAKPARRVHDDGI